MKRLVLDNFTLVEYEENNAQHKDVVSRIVLNDEDGYLRYLEQGIKLINQRKNENDINYCYIAYYNDYPVGYISIFYFSNAYRIIYGMLPEYRRQNLCALLLEEFSEKMLENNKIDELVLDIFPDNIGSIKVAELADYKQTDEFTHKRQKM